jgi:ferredoxin
MARGIRNAARRVASAYITRGAANADLTAEDIASMSWPEVLDRGLAQRLRFEKDGVLRIEILLLRIRDEAMGRALIGPDAWNRVTEQAADRLPASRPWFVGLDGGLEALFRPQILFLARDADTLRFTTPDYIPLAEPRAGMVDGQLRNHGVLLVDESVDPALPFTWIATFGTDIGTDSARYPGEGARPVVAADRAQDSVVTDAARVEPSPRRNADSAAATSETIIADTVLAVTTAVTETVVVAETDSALTATPGVQPGELGLLDFPDEEDESVLQRSIAQTSWPRFAILAVLLVFTCVAFFSKRVAIRRAVLGSAIVLLGFGGVGFLSVSHITSAIKVGPSVFLEDFTLLLFVAFTVITTLLWGRVFCGYLCPFGALQDLLDRIVPKRFQRELPEFLHKRALLAKYGILAIVIVPAVAGSTTSIFEYVEPFGTVFFLSPSIGLWIIAMAILAAAATVPRFYCRYVCPLGASLAVVSVVSPFRIRRVEQCTVCMVCEQDCPTGAITGPTIDFKECVRCNICEVNLIEQVGVCRHDMAEVRDQLVQLQVRGRRGART